jgi:hypothetical protein
VSDYPSGSPNRFDDWDKMLADLDRVLDSIKMAVSDTLAHPNAILPSVLRPIRDQVEKVRNEFRHVVNYARDAERGNEVLRERLHDGADTGGEET